MNKVFVLFEIFFARFKSADDSPSMGLRFCPFRRALLVHTPVYRTQTKLQRNLFHRWSKEEYNLSASYRQYALQDRSTIPPMPNHGLMKQRILRELIFKLQFWVDSPYDWWVYNRIS